ncbi:6-phospho-3-hexuloisomerase [Lachnospiraceae bacterium 38-10]
MLRNNPEIILEELADCFGTLDHENRKNMIDRICGADRIFVAGVGRTGYVMRCFSMRLMQAGYSVFWIGDNNTPSAGEGDLIILGSGSGETGVLCNYMRTAKRMGLNSIVLTTADTSTLAKEADTAIVLKGNSKFQKENDCGSVQPMGALFEQELLIYLDSLILDMMELGLTSADRMKQKHANLE